jgi:hypothetical protein
MSRTCKIMMTVVLSTAGITANAGYTEARISRLLIDEDSSLVYVYPVGGVQNAPSCHGQNGNYYSFSLTRPRAKEYYAALLAAQVAGLTVTFHGKGVCTDQTFSETLNYISILTP